MTRGYPRTWNRWLEDECGLIGLGMGVAMMIDMRRVGVIGLYCQLKVHVTTFTFGALPTRNSDLLPLLPVLLLYHYNSYYRCYYFTIIIPTTITTGAATLPL